MEEIKIKEVTYENMDDLGWICVPSKKRDDPAFVKGVEEKRRWQWRCFRVD